MVKLEELALLGAQGVCRCDLELLDALAGLVVLERGRAPGDDRDQQGKSYESWIEYSDELVRSPLGWRSRVRIARVQLEEGDRSVLGPGQGSAPHTV